jgi:hypothetical protein
VPRTYIALDLETTGLEPTRDAIIEVGAVLPLYACTCEPITAKPTHDKRNYPANPMQLPAGMMSLVAWR